MKALLGILALLPLVAVAESSFFFTLPQNTKPNGQRIEGDNLHLIVPIQKVAPPKASSIFAFHQGLGEGRMFKIQVNLTESPEKGWTPMLKLGEEVIMEGISVARPDDAKFASSFSLESSDPEEIRNWCKQLGILLKIPNERILIDLEKAEQAEQAEQGEAGEAE